MQVSHRGTRKFLQFFNGIHDHNLLAILTNPQRKWSTPKPTSTHSPISRILKPIMKPFFLHKVRYPVCLFIVLQQFIFNLFYSHKPAGYSPVDEGSIRSPTKRIAVSKTSRFDEPAFLFHCLDNIFISILDIALAEFNDSLGKTAIVIHCYYQWFPLLNDAILHTDTVIIFTKCRSTVNNSDKALFIQLRKHPPYGLHEIQIHGLIIVPEINPPSHSNNRLLPLVDIPLHNPSAFLVIIRNPHLNHVLSALNTQFQIDFMLHRQPVAIPSESPGHVMTRHGLIPGHDILDSSGQNVPVVREASGERGSVVENVLRQILGELELGFEGIDFIPP
ncbi:hypothetical protein MIMGU_mgv1a009767mg [Erythranthe guttata]|uniref:Uncharacterized protein n=1 Tax=Erythranthe guttata TaxID=4155 RepID=A0A022S4B6_ERYGU|nr:hypothetical protein MIMGU_mgv1a009767mg [Erythranthe guttata]